MASTNISRYHGKVSKCSCGLADNPKRATLRSCHLCFGRGYVAECLSCGGKGQVEEKMAGGPGTMKATCTPCGGVGMFGVNKPADWVDEPIPATAA